MDAMLCAITAELDWKYFFAEAFKVAALLLTPVIVWMTQKHASKTIDRQIAAGDRQATIKADNELTRHQEQLSFEREMAWRHEKHLALWRLYETSQELHIESSLIKSYHSEEIDTAKFSDLFIAQASQMITLLFINENNDVKASVEKVLSHSKKIIDLIKQDPRGEQFAEFDKTRDLLSESLSIFIKESQKELTRPSRVSNRV